MNTPQQSMSPHLPDEILAAYVDERLSGAARSEVEEHLATCDDCHAVWQSVAEFRETEGAERGAVVSGRFRWPIAAAAALAAVVVVGVFQDRLPGFEPTGMAALVRDANDAPTRPFASRLSGDFAYRKPKDSLRGGGAGAVLAVRDSADAIVADPDAAPRDKAAAYLYLGKARDAARTLERELLAKTNAPDVAKAIDRSGDAELLNDLAAAYLQSGNDAAALAASARAMRVDASPRPRFNHALALQRLGRDADALAAWKDYLRIEPDEHWRAEARSHMDWIRKLSE